MLTKSLQPLSLSPFSINLLALMSMLGLVLVSVSIGISDFSWANIWQGRDNSLQLLMTSRLPRTLAIVLTGASVAVAGMKKLPFRER